MTALREHKALRVGAALLVVIVGGAFVVELFGGPALFGRFQSLAIAVALVVSFVSVAVDEGPEASDRKFTRIGLAGSAVLLVGAILDLVL